MKNDIVWIGVVVVVLGLAIAGGLLFLGGGSRAASVGSPPGATVSARSIHRGLAGPRRITESWSIKLHEEVNYYLQHPFAVVFFFAVFFVAFLTTFFAILPSPPCARLADRKDTYPGLRGPIRCHQSVLPLRAGPEYHFLGRSMLLHTEVLLPTPCPQCP